MPIIKFRVHLTGSRRLDRLCGGLLGLAAWTLVGLALLRSDQAARALLNPWLGQGYLQLALGGLLLAVLLAARLGLSRVPRARAFLGSLVLAIAGLAPICGVALLGYFIYCHCQAG